MRAAPGASLLAAAVAALLLAASSAGAQVVTDGALGPVRRLGGDSVRIGSELGTRRGANLFHSFSRFDAPAGGSVVFDVDPGVGRVIGRVTGGRASRIDGAVGIARDGLPVAGVGFWLINPAGIEIGPDAQFRTGGSLGLSAGDALVFADGATFPAGASRRIELSAAAPAAFGFLDRAPGRLGLDGASLQVEGALFALGGGEVALEGARIEAQIGGDVILAAGARGETAPLSASAPAPRPAGGLLRLEGGAAVLSRAGGAIALRGGAVEIEGATVRSEAGAAPGGAIRVAAGRLAVLDGGDLGSTTSGGAAAAGAIAVAAGEVVLSRGGAIRSQTQGPGRAGDIAVTGFRALLVTRDGVATETAIETDVASGAMGDAGRVTIRGGRITLADGGRIFSNSSGRGDAGSVRVRATGIVATGGGQIGSGALDNPDAPEGARGDGGAVDIVATGAIALSGVRRDTAADAEPEPSGFFSGTEGTASGRGGRLSVEAAEIRLSDEAEIGAETFNASPAGALRLTGGTLLAEGGAEVITRSRKGGRAGAIAIAMDGDVIVRDGAEINSVALSPGGRAGAVSVSADAVSVGEGSRITTDSAATDGGALVVAGRRFVLLDGGAVTTSVAASDGDGGAIDVTGGPIALRDGARIQANADAGDGGRVTLGNVAFFLERGSVIEADSNTGADGAVLVLGAEGTQAAETDPLPTAFFDAFALIDDACVATVAGGSALSREGRGGQPFTGAAAPALFGDAIAYPAGAGGSAAAAAPDAGSCPQARR